MSASAPDLFKGLLSRGVTGEQASKVRVWAGAERIAKEIRVSGTEFLEDDVAP